MNSCTREALRYLRAGPGDAVALALVEEGFATLEAVAPRHIWRAFPTGLLLNAFQSQTLASHLEGCEEAALFAATLGTEADGLIRRAEAINMAQAAALHACAAAKIEAYCDTVQAEIEGAKRPRYSPGYGDFPLSAQKTLLALLDAQRRIGLYITSGGMLAPMKSITAVLGFGEAKEGCKGGKCGLCEKLDCAFRGDHQQT